MIKKQVWFSADRPEPLFFFPFPGVVDVDVEGLTSFVAEFWPRFSPFSTTCTGVVLLNTLQVLELPPSSNKPMPLDYNVSNLAKKDITFVYF